MQPLEQNAQVILRTKPEPPSKRQHSIARSPSTTSAYLKQRPLSERLNHARRSAAGSAYCAHYGGQCHENVQICMPLYYLHRLGRYHLTLLPGQSDRCATRHSTQVHGMKCSTTAPQGHGGSRSSVWHRVLRLTIEIRISTYIASTITILIYLLIHTKAFVLPTIHFDSIQTLIT